MPLEKQAWVAGIKENPIHDTSFVNASTDMSEYVENNILHLAEAGVDPLAYVDYFKADGEAELPIVDIKDIPNEVPLSTISTEATRHRSLEEIELNYKRRESIIARHKKSISQRIGKIAANIWCADTNNDFNKVLDLGSNSIIDAIVDARAQFMNWDKSEELNICLSPEHWAQIKKEDNRLFKDLMAMKDKNYVDFKVWSYSQNPIFTASGTKKPIGAAQEATDTKSSFMWVSNEVFRSFGDLTPFLEESKARIQADLLSYGQRALVGNIRASNPKYRIAIR